VYSFRVRPRVAFVYQNPRAPLVDEVRAGRAPDSTLLGVNHLEELGIDAFVHDLWLARRPLPRRLARTAWNLREVVGPWELAGADAVVTPLATLFPLAAKVRRGLRVVVVNYGLCTTWARSTRARRRLLAASLRSASAVVCLADSQARLTAEQTGASTVTVPLGIDERFWSPLPSSPGEPFVLAAGKDLARDYATFAEAVRGLDARAELAVYPRNLDGIALPPNARAAVVGPERLRELYGGCGCVVIPQRRDGYSYGSEGGGLTALLEAWAMARPVVVTDRAVIRDYVSERTALTVPPADPGALREAIERLLGDRELAARLGAAGRSQVEREHTTRRFAERLAPLLHATAGSSVSTNK
jgi:glycosyltransferase involved in cell wall biosynthesis